MHKILVVDDDPDILNFIKHDFSQYLIEIVTCSNVDQAIELLKKEQFSLGIFDIVMGEGLSSEALMKFIREDHAGDNKYLPLSIMSAHMNENYAKKLRLKGSTIYCTIKKPLVLKQLSQTILGLNQRTILIIDDDFDIISLMKMELENGSYQVLSSPRNELAQKIVELIAIDIVVIDNKLGVDSDSTDFIDFLQKKFPNIPCVLTGKEVRSDLLKNDTLNILGTVSKPFERGALLELANNYFIKKENTQGSDNEKLQISDNAKKENDIYRIKGEGPSDIGESNTLIKGSASDSSLDKNIMTFKSLFNDEDTKNECEGYSVNQRNKNGQTPIMIYCYLGDLINVKRLVEQGADVRLKSRSGKSCLHYSASSLNVELFKYLVEKQDLKVNEKDENNFTPLYIAIKSGSSEMVKACVDLGARLNFSIEGKSYLSFAVIFGFSEIVTFLIEQGVDISKKDYKGMSPMDYAVKGRRKDILNILKQEFSS